MGGIDKSEVPFDLVDALNMCLWDLKHHDYSHYDVMDNRIIKTNEDMPKPRSKGININTETFE